MDELKPKRIETLDEYQKETLRTAGSTQADAPGLSMTALGLCGEAGEYADAVKKALFHSHPLDREHLKKELGDCFWYLAVAAHQLGFSLSEIANANAEKLRKRYPNGFSVDKSINRES